jgi:hypothetical protein
MCGSLKVEAEKERINDHFIVFAFIRDDKRVKIKIRINKVYQILMYFYDWA